MTLSHEDLHSLIGRASSLSERLQSGFSPSGNSGDQAEDRLARWKQLAAGNDPERFAQVLATYGLERAPEIDLLARLGPVRPSVEHPSPPWASTLAELVRNLSEAAHPGPPENQWKQTGSGGKIPFEPLFHSLASIAWRQVEIECPIVLHWFPAAVEGLRAHLARRLSGIAAVPLHDVFLAHKALAVSVSSRRTTSPSNGSHPALKSRGHYDAFLHEQSEDGLKAFFLFYPVAARLVAEATMFWLDAVIEFVRRYENDKEVLSYQFNAGAPLGRVAKVRAGLSDAHHRGRTVIIVTFQSGLRLVYKPRPMRVDTLFVKLVVGLNIAGKTPDLVVPKVIDCGAYGWMEFAAHAPCTSRQAAKRFYLRAGALASLVHWLQGIDCHRENFVAAGEYPVLIDLEALGHPLRPEETSDPNWPSPWHMAGSVLRTGLLPYWQSRVKRDGFYDNTALGAPVLQRPVIGSVCWADTNSDQVRWRFSERAQRHAAHRPRLGNRALTVRDYANEVVGGFSTMTAVLGSTGNETFKAVREQIQWSIRRLIKRPTLVYAIMLRRSLRPENLTNGVERSLALQGLANGPTTFAERAMEIESLERLDVPYFRVDPGTKYPASSSTTSIAPREDRQHQEVVQLSVQRQILLESGKFHNLHAWHKAK